MQGEDEADETEAVDDEPDDAAAAAEARVQLDAAAKAPVKPVAEPERQLSKKELKKKELEDMDAVLAELGIEVAVVRGRRAACSTPHEKPKPRVWRARDIARP